jgi:hypothetical protein
MRTLADSRRYRLTHFYKPELITIISPWGFLAIWAFDQPLAFVALPRVAHIR